MLENPKTKVKGHSGEVYKFEIRFYGPNDPEFEDIGGIYIFHKIELTLTEGVKGVHLYIGETGSFRDRVNDHHPKWGNAVEKDMNMILLFPEANEERRKIIERDLIDEHNPILNERS